MSLDQKRNLNTGRGQRRRLAARMMFLLATVALGEGVLASDWPEYRGLGRAGVWDESGVIEEFEALKIEWRAPIGAGYSGPTVAGDRVFVMDRPAGPEEAERVLCLDRETGKQLWAHQYPCHYAELNYPLGPRSSVTIDGERAYALGAMGHLHCLDVESGKVLWFKDCDREYAIDLPNWGIAASPLVEGEVVVAQIGGTNGACVVAFDKNSGKEVWRAFDDKASYVSPIMIDQAGRRVLVVWTGFRIAGMDAASGKVFWELEARPHRMPINVPGPALDAKGERMFLTTFYDGSRMLKIHQDKLAVEELWYRKGVSETKTDALHSMISPPYIAGDHIYGVDSYGELRCLEAAGGDRVWESLDAAVPTGRWATIFMVRNGDRTWMFNELGELILAELTPRGYREISRAQLIEPTTPLKRRTGTGIVWSQPAFAHKHVFARNDRELVCASLEGNAPSLP